MVVRKFFMADREPRPRADPHKIAPARLKSNFSHLSLCSQLIPSVSLFSALVVFDAMPVWTQSPLHFEVASVRPTTAAPGTGTIVELLPGGRIRIVNEPAKLLIRLAF